MGGSGVGVGVFGGGGRGGGRGGGLCGLCAGAWGDFLCFSDFHLFFFLFLFSPFG